jgi:hypothetical protein
VTRAIRLLAALALAACDWVGSAFMNSIPLEGTHGPGEDFYVYIGVDGLSWNAVQAAMGRGVFQGAAWRAAKLVTIFPGTSDASWTRILHTAKIPGYELQYYDPGSDSLVNGGLAGVVEHVMPSLSEDLSFEAPWIGAFDYQSYGYSQPIESYVDPWISFCDTLDGLFYVLEGRAETGSVFSAYLLEIDVFGHVGTPEDCTQMLVMLADRIESFRAAHPGRKFHFTVLSDHGMDQVGGARLIDFRDELPKVGVMPVESLANHDPLSEIYAIPVVHTRVSYLALHTHPDLIAEVGLRVSNLESVDFAVGRLPPSDGAAAWYGFWSEGRLATSFGYRPESSTYVLPQGGDYARWGISPSFAPGESFKLVRDEDLFALTKDGKYPDLFYRVRTALTAVGVEYPADILVSFGAQRISIGFKLPGQVDTFSGRSHGAAGDVATLGVLLTDERDLPDAVRADGFLTLFPRMAAHMIERGVTLIDGDPDAARPNR